MTNLNKILNSISHGPLSAAAIVNHSGLSFTQLTEAVRPAVKSGKVIKTGKGPGANYHIAPEDKIELPTFTDAEINMLAAFYQTSTDCCGACNDEENMSYMNANDLKDELGLSKQAIGGIMSSLSDKNAIVDTLESARGAKINDWVIQSYIAESFADTLENHVVIKSKTKTEKILDIADTESDMITLKQICELNGGILTTSARRKLRKANVKHSTHWEWAKGTDLTDIIAIITK